MTELDRCNYRISMELATTVGRMCGVYGMGLLQELEKHLKDLSEDGSISEMNNSYTIIQIGYHIHHRYQIEVNLYMALSSYSNRSNQLKKTILCL